MFSSKKISCVVCNKKIPKQDAIKKQGVYICSSDCLEKYQRMLEAAKQDSNLDNCCE